MVGAARIDTARRRPRTAASGGPNEALQLLTDTLILLSLIFLGPLYFAWTVWRRRSRRQL